MSRKLNPWVLAVASAVLLASSLLSALWMISSFSLAFAACKGYFSLFGESFRCRQPHIAVLLAGACFAASLWTAYLWVRHSRRGRGIEGG